MSISIIVAKSLNNIIGANNDLIWRLSADLKRFKALTTGNTIIMGRKTFESIGRALPNRDNIIITRNTDLQIEGCKTANSIEEAISISNPEKEIFIIGGGEIYKQSINIANKLHLTIVHENFEGDTYFPEINLDEWDEISAEKHLKDEKNEYDYSFIDYIRK
ncbi:MAG: dihydrofolate reductase [Marinifilaceae bacterium]|jgi:dihydrofolate reductase|nr:dihydrofolate reductase [Marinifilaceae bacterium]